MKQDLQAQEFIRQRVAPQPGDLFYLHLSDLAIALRQLIPAHAVRVLDYGCGGSPYRQLFGLCTYHRADLAGTESVDFTLTEDSRLPSDLGEYDCVLSSQVLEHVSSPMVYLKECYRVLKKGGCLVLSTHGTFEDHSCPGDYWRWTAHGLRKLVEDVGFTVDRTKKTTTGPRAAMFLSEREFGRFKFKGAGICGNLLTCGILAVRTPRARRRHIACDTSFREYRVVDADERGHEIYIAIVQTATKE
jgi:SAM-dependent methyltransferase